MKAIKITVLLMSLSALAYAQKITVKGNTRLNTDLSKYKTYSWATTDETNPGVGAYEIYSFAQKLPEVTPEQWSRKKADSLKDVEVVKSQKPKTYVYSYSVIIPATNDSTNSILQKAIAAELEGRGYRNDEINSDLLVTYKVLERKAKLKGYVNDDPKVVGGKEVREPQDTVTHLLKPGTLLINLIDVKTSEVVWEGFVSGLIQGKTFTADPTKLKKAVHLVFTKLKIQDNKLTGRK